jgi:hypothetical protein
MAKRRGTRARTPKKPEGDIAAVANLDKLNDILEAGELKINKGKLQYFIKTKLKGIAKPKVKFVARNAPFMRQPPIPV